MTFDPSEQEQEPLGGNRQPVCVRDVSWHSQVWYLILRVTSSDVFYYLGTCPHECCLGEFRKQQ